jgi:hypothetical protein
MGITAPVIISLEDCAENRMRDMVAHLGQFQVTTKINLGLPSFRIFHINT